MNQQENRNRPIDIENKLMVFTGKWRGVGGISGRMGIKK